MKLADIDPKVTPWSVATVRKVGRAWSFKDHVVMFDGKVMRSVFHYSTRMGYFTLDDDAQWYFVPVSTGESSVSDQAGMNKIMHGYGWWFRRAGHAAYVNVSGGPLRVVVIGVG